MRASAACTAHVGAAAADVTRAVEADTPLKPRRGIGGLFAPSPYSRRRKWAIFATAILLIVLAAAKLLAGAGQHGVVIPLLMSALDWVRGLGVWSVPMLFACEAVCFLLLLPISPLHIGIGFLWGAWHGTLLAWAAYTLGCVPPFLLTRVPCLTERFRLLRRRADLLDGVFAAVENEPFKLIVCLRLSPLLPQADQQPNHGACPPTQDGDGTHPNRSSNRRRRSDGDGSLSASLSARPARRSTPTCSDSPPCRCARTSPRRSSERCPT